MTREGWLKTETVEGHYHWYQPSEEMLTTGVNMPVEGGLPEIFHMHMYKGAIGTTTQNQAENDSDFHFHQFPAP